MIKIIQPVLVFKITLRAQKADRLGRLRYECGLF